MTPRSIPGLDHGTIYALAAYGLWGLFPIYWKALEHVDPPEVLAHRIIWTVPFVALVLTFTRGWQPAIDVLRRPLRLLSLSLTGLLIALNWGIFIWAVGNERVLEASLGYYLAPLLAVAVGFVVYGERLSSLQWIAIALATLGMLNEAATFGAVPWAAIGMGISFAAYGAIRKATPIDAPSGLFLESAILAPFALALVAWLDFNGQASFTHASGSTDLLLMMGGIVTAIPLLLYVSAARRLPMTTLGLLFYLTPTLQLVVGVALYGEPFPVSRAVTFTLVWSGLALFVVASRRNRSAPSDQARGIRP